MPTQIFEKQLERLRDLLPHYRKLMGYSADRLAGFLGLERQQISRLENGKTKLTQVHFRAIADLITETIGEIKDETEINIALFVILVIIKLNEDYIDDEEYSIWKDIIIQFTKLKDIGDSDNQIKLLKGFAIAYKNLNEGDVVPTIQLLDKVVTSFREFIR